MEKSLSNAEKLISRFWVLNWKPNGSFQVSFLFKTLSKNREVIFCVILIRKNIFENSYKRVLTTLLYKAPKVYRNPKLTLESKAVASWR